MKKKRFFSTIKENYKGLSTAVKAFWWFSIITYCLEFGYSTFLLICMNLEINSTSLNNIDFDIFYSILFPLVYFMLNLLLFYFKKLNMLSIVILIILRITNTLGIQIWLLLIWGILEMF